MSPLSPPFAVRPREDQFVADVANLLRRHRVRTGSPEYLALLAPVLRANNALRSDLLMLCNAISRMAESDLAPEEMLQLVAKAVSGPRGRNREVAVPAELRDLFMTSWQEYQARAESLSAAYWGDLESPAEATVPAAGKFAVAASRNANQANEVSTPQGNSEIPPDTRIGELTLSQLRTYLDEIEQRVGRLQPYIADLEAALPAGVVAPRSSEPGEAGAIEAGEAGSHVASGSASIQPAADTLDDQSAAAEVLPENAIPESMPAAAEVHPKEAQIHDVAPIRIESELRPLRLTLRETLPAEESTPVDSDETEMFRLVSNNASPWPRRLLWAAAALALLAPAAYYGKPYVYPAPAPMPVSAPEPPAYPPSRPAAPVAAKPAPTSAAALRANVHSTPRLLPKEVHMEAQAARAQER